MPEDNPMLVEFEKWLRSIAERKSPISIKVAAELTGMSEEYIRDQKEKIGYSKYGTEIRFVPTVFAAWLRSRYVVPVAKKPHNRPSATKPEPR